MERLVLLVLITSFFLVAPAAAQHADQRGANLPSWAAPGERGTYGSSYERSGSRSSTERYRQNGARNEADHMAPGPDYRSSGTGEACPPSSWNPGGEPPCGRVPDRGRGNPGDPEEIPVDGGLSLLFAAGAGYAAYRLREEDEAEDNDEPAR